jgi:hypothetical protein
VAAAVLGALGGACLIGIAGWIIGAMIGSALS